MGVIKIEKFFNEAKLSEAYVEKEFREKGIRTLLFDECIKWAKERNVYEFYLTIVEGNELALNYWMGRGFRRGELRSKLITFRRRVNEDIVK